MSSKQPQVPDNEKDMALGRHLLGRGFNCHVCKGEGFIRFGLLWRNVRKCDRCKGKGYVLPPEPRPISPPPPPPPKKYRECPQCGHQH